MKKFTSASLMMALLMGLSVSTPLTVPAASAKTVMNKQERREHPRIVKAIKELEKVIQYLQNAPHDFGGHKAEAIEASRNAITQLNKALAYNERMEEKKERK